MEREPTKEDLKAAWARFREPWDFHDKPVLRLPLNLPMLPYDIVIRDGRLPPFGVRHVEVRIEYGRLNDKRAYRLVGTVPGTDLSVELERGLFR